MLNPFPTLLSLSFFAPLMLRLALGLIFVHAGYLKLYKNREQAKLFFRNSGLPAPIFFYWLVALAEALAGISLVAGFETQICAMIVGIITLGGLIFKLKNKESLAQSVDFYIFALVISIALIFLGAGAMAVDLPL